MSRHGFRSPHGKQLTKYHAVAVHIDGHRFQSRAEARRYMVLKALLSAGKIRALTCQVRFPLRVAQYLITTYIADFSYFTVPDGTFVIEDVKGWRGGVPYSMFKIKAKLLRALTGLQVTEMAS